jgi:hypothetical protein
MTARAGRGRHVEPAVVRRGSIVVRVLVCATFTVAGILLVVPQDVPRIVTTPRHSGPDGSLLIGGGLVVVGWLPVADLLVRNGPALRRVAGVWPGRLATTAAVLTPFAVIAGCVRTGQRWGWLWAAAVVILVVAQGWALAGLWHRSPGASGG